MYRCEQKVVLVVQLERSTVSVGVPPCSGTWTYLNPEGPANESTSIQERNSEDNSHPALCSRPERELHQWRWCPRGRCSRRIVHNSLQVSLPKQKQRNNDNPDDGKDNNVCKQSCISAIRDTRKVLTWSFPALRGNFSLTKYKYNEHQTNGDEGSADPVDCFGRSNICIE